MGQLIDLTGMRFGKLVVIARAEDHIQKSGAPKAMWKCKCDCGNECIVYGQALRGGFRIDCGCGSFERHSEISKKTATTHGESNTRLYRVWRAMRERCEVESSHNYHGYGERGISVDPKWEQYKEFRDWANRNGYDENAKRGKTTLDRIDVNGNYTPENCRFVDQKTQCRNKRNNYNIKFNGVTKCISDWAKEVNIERLTLRRRLKSEWPIEKALTTPVGQGERKKVWKIS